MLMPLPGGVDGLVSMSPCAMHRMLVLRVATEHVERLSV